MKNKLAACLGLAAFFCCTALSMPTARAEAQQENAAAAGPALEIASGFCGPGMNRPYEAGYMPQVGQAAARIVLPLKPAWDPAPDSISVAVDLGDTASPFVFENYDLRVPLRTAANGQDSMYLIDLEIPLEDTREGGRYPVSFVCSGIAASGAFNERFTVYVTVPPGDAAAQDTGADDPVLLPGDLGDDPSADGADPGDGGEPDSYVPDVWSAPDAGGGDTSGAAPTPEPTAPPQPKLMVTAVAVSPAVITAGDTFSISVSIKNTSPSVPASNLLLTAEGDGTDLFVPDGHGSMYLDRVKPGEVFTLNTAMSCAPDAGPGPKTIAIHAGYDGPEGTAYSQDMSLAAEVTQPVRFSVDEPQIPDLLQAGDTWSLPLNVMNLGRAAIRNVCATVDAPGIRAQNTLFLGNLDSGSAKQGTLYAFVGSKSEAEGEARYGRTTGVITVTCEDEFGTSYEQETPFSLVIDAPVFRSDKKPEEEEPDEEPAFGWQYSLLTGGGIAAGAAAIWAAARRREKRRHAAR